MIQAADLRLLFVGMLVLGAVTGIAAYDKSIEQLRLDTSQNDWESYVGGVSDGYEFEYFRSCRCPDRGPFQVIVDSAGNVASAIYLADSDTPGAVADPKQVMTVEEAHDDIQRALDKPAHKLDVTYAPAAEGGYPTFVYIDWHRRIVDEETSFTIRNVALIE